MPNLSRPSSGSRGRIFNCIEGLPVFGGLSRSPSWRSASSITAPLALSLLGAHRPVVDPVASLSVTADPRSASMVFAVQLIITAAPLQLLC